MVKWIETTGRTEEDAIAAALFQLGLERDDVSVEVVERAKSGFLGFGSNPAKVRVSYEDENGTPKPLRRRGQDTKASLRRRVWNGTDHLGVVRRGFASGTYRAVRGRRTVGGGVAPAWRL